MEIAWVPGHCEISGNEAADYVAKRATSTRPRDPPFTSLTHLRRKAKEELLENWTARWVGPHLRSHFGPANRLPPTLKPRKHFRELPRELYGRVIQCRTGHAVYGEYYMRREIEEQYSCPCGAYLQITHRTRTIILRDRLLSRKELG